MNLNKKANGYGKQVVTGVLILFIVTFLVLIFNVVFNYHLAPAFKNNLGSSAVEVQASTSIDFILYTFWDKIPYILGGSLLLYLLVRIVKKEPTEVQQNW